MVYVKSSFHNSSFTLVLSDTTHTDEHINWVTELGDSLTLIVAGKELATGEETKGQMSHSSARISSV